MRTSANGAADENAATALMASIAGELAVLFDWQKGGLITADEHALQVKTLLSNKLPVVTTGHGSKATAVMQELQNWRAMEYINEEEHSRVKALVLKAAIQTSFHSAPSMAPAPTTATATAAPSLSFAASRQASRPSLSVKPDAPISPLNRDSPPSSGTLTRSLLKQACRADGATLRALRSSRDSLTGDPASSWADLNRHTSFAAAAAGPSSALKANLAVTSSSPGETDGSSPLSPAAALDAGDGRVSGRGLRRRSFDLSGKGQEETDVTADLTDLDLMLNMMRKDSENVDGSFKKKTGRSRFNLLATEAANSGKQTADERPKHGALYTACKRLGKRIPIFHPENRLLTTWHLMICSFVIASAVVVPLMVAFEGEMPISVRRSLSTMDDAFDVAFILDIIVSCNISFRKDGFLVTSRRLIWHNYFRTWFVLDFISSLPLSWFVRDHFDAAAELDLASTVGSFCGNALGSESGAAGGGGSADFTRINKLLRLVKLGKLLRILKLFKIFDRLAEDAHFNPASFRLMSLLASMIFMSHLFGCLWYMVLSWTGGTLCEYELMRNGTWNGGDGYDHDSRYPFDELIEANKRGADGITRKWLLCFTWAVGMFSGMMPVELHPWREEEMVFDIVALVFAMGFNAMIISSCSSLMTAMDYLARHHKAKLDRVRDYMRFNHVPADLSHTILEYYKYICLNSQTKEDVKDFVDLPQQLHFKLVIALHRELITKCSLFVQFDNNSILRILSFLRPFTLPPETVVLRQGKSHDAMYFVGRGMLWAVENYMTVDPNALPERHLATLEDHDFFGDEGVLNGEPPKFTVVAKTYCVLMAITRADFDAAAPRIKGGPSLRDLSAKVQSLHTVVGLAKARPTLDKPRRSGTGGPGMAPASAQGSSASLFRLSKVLGAAKPKRNSSRLSGTDWTNAIDAATRNSDNNSSNRSARDDASVGSLTPGPAAEAVESATAEEEPASTDVGVVQAEVV